MRKVFLFLICFMVQLSLMQAPAHAGWFKKMKKKIKKAAETVVEEITDTTEDVADWFKDTTVDSYDDVSKWFKKSGKKVSNYTDELIKYEKVMEEVIKTGYTNSGGIDYTEPEPAGNLSGIINVTTYNVDGFPKTIGGNSKDNTKEISSILEDLALDIVVFQEDFTKHKQLMSRLTTDTYPYRSDHYAGSATGFGDGLVTISNIPFDKDSLKRKQWPACGGTLWEYIVGDTSSPDCSTEKGFTLARMSVDGDFTLDMYNLHQDAGKDDDSLNAKEDNLAYLAEYINSKSADNVVIVAGDFNQNWSESSSGQRHLDLWKTFLDDTGLTMVSKELFGNFDEIDAMGFNYPDHILYRGTDDIALSSISIEQLIDDFGEKYDLSDHYALKGVLSWDKL